MHCCRIYMEDPLKCHHLNGTNVELPWNFYRISVLFPWIFLQNFSGYFLGISIELEVKFLSITVELPPQ